MAAATVLLLLLLLLLLMGRHAERRRKEPRIVTGRIGASASLLTVCHASISFLVLALLRSPLLISFSSLFSLSFFLSFSLFLFLALVLAPARSLVCSLSCALSLSFAPLILLLLHFVYFPFLLSLIRARAFSSYRSRARLRTSSDFWPFKIHPPGWMYSYILA